MAMDIFAGCLGGCAGVLVGYPMDTVKVRLQTQSSSNRIYRGTFHCVSTIIKQESFRGLYKGMTSPMVGLTAVNGIIFGVQGNVIRALSSPDSLWSQFLAGSAAGFVQSFVTSPMELAKTRMQLQGQSNPDIFLSHWSKNRIFYKNPLDCLVKVFRGEGVRGLYRGIGCTIMRDAPAFGVYFSGYEYLTKLVSDSKGNINTLPLLFVGGLAGVLSWIASYPFDVVKSRLQADGMAGSEEKYKGFWDCTKKSYKTEGLRVFTLGLNSTLIRAFPTNAATLTVVTWVLLFCESSAGTKLHVEKRSGTLLLDDDLQTLAC